MFMPGGAGAPEFWYPLGEILPACWKKTYMSWPGLGNQPHGPSIQSYDDLVALAEKEIRGPTVLVAQSLGGIIGIRLALKHPSKITRLILTATSGGVDIASLGGQDWRPGYLMNFPDAARWIITENPDHTKDLQHLSCPTLLIWASDDSISPVPVGRHFLSLIPNAQLHVLECGGHQFARDRAAEVAPIIASWLVRLDTDMPAAI
jgi:pimeloyl-ACP methyl ester carboxylesterase